MDPNNLGSSDDGNYSEDQKNDFMGEMGSPIKHNNKSSDKSHN